jgi:inosine-uridine nucleoside N-ribohydrolase
MPLPIKVLLDTDVGTDVDDALALVLASPEIDLRAVTSGLPTHHTRHRMIHSE